MLSQMAVRQYSAFKELSGYSVVARVIDHDVDMRAPLSQRVMVRKMFYKMRVRSVDGAR